MKTLIFRSLYAPLLCQISFAHGWRAPEAAAGVQNSVANTPESRKLGKKVYFERCSSCHGGGATGMSKDDTGQTMHAPNLIKRLANHSEGDFFWKIQNGRGEMPSFEEDLSDEDTWHMVNFIKGLAKP